MKERKEAQMNDVLYVAVFRITPNESRDEVGVVHAAWLDFLKERGIGTIPGEITVKEFAAEEQIEEACQPENKGKYVMAADHEALRQLGLSFEAANRLVTVVRDTNR